MLSFLGIVQYSHLSSSGRTLIAFVILQKCVRRGLQGLCGGCYSVCVEWVTGWTAPPIEDPPDLKKAE